MIPDISDPRVFYVTLEDPQGHELYEEINPLAQGVRIAPAEERGKGYVSWYDLVGNYQRTIEISEPPRIEKDGQTYKVKNADDGLTIVFQFLSKYLYDTVVHKLLTGSPEMIKDDTEIQDWFINLSSQ